MLIAEVACSRREPWCDVLMGCDALSCDVVCLSGKEMFVLCSSFKVHPGNFKYLWRSVYRVRCMFLNSKKYLMPFPLVIKDRVEFLKIPHCLFWSAGVLARGFGKFYSGPRPFGLWALDSGPASGTFKGGGQDAWSLLQVDLFPHWPWHDFLKRV